MEQSPLTQQARPETFTPKVVGLYQSLFQDPHAEHNEGFWRELFLLRAEIAPLRSILQQLSVESLLRQEVPTQELFHRATLEILSGSAPSDENALDTLTVFLECVLTKKYPDPNSDIIVILAGLEGIDATFTEFVNSVEVTIRDGRVLDVRQKANRAALAAVTGAYQTALISFFIGKDFFPALMKLIQDADNHYRMFGPFMLLGLLVNYNKFEFQNPYQLRLEDFVNDAAIKTVIEGLRPVFEDLRKAFIDIQDDQPEVWARANPLAYIGLTSRPSTPTLTEDEIKKAFNAMPLPEAAILLSVYDFTNANKLFCHNFVANKHESSEASTFSAFLSFGSYMFHNAHRSNRAALYAYTMLVIIRILVEDPPTVKYLTSTETSQQIRLCRQRPPYLPYIRGSRVLALYVLDALMDGISHNLRRRLDVELYLHFLRPIQRFLTYLSGTRVRLSYHWSELWKTLLSFLKFMTTYVNDLRQLQNAEKLADTLAGILAQALTAGEVFLPDAKSHDDLFYKILEAGDIVKQFKDAYGLSKRGSAPAIDALLAVSNHYGGMLAQQKGKTPRSMSPREIMKLIKQGYETLSIERKESLDQWNRYREVDYRILVKRLSRCAVTDVKRLLEQRH